MTASNLGFRRNSDYLRIYNVNHKKVINVKWITNDSNK